MTQAVDIETSGVYAIVISSKASAWWQNFPQFLKRFFQDDNLSVSLSGYSEELKWNGNDLKGATQTNIFISAFTEGSYSLSFKSSQTPEVSTLSIFRITSTAVNVAEFLPTPVEDKDRRPLLKLLCLDQPLIALTLTASVLPGKVHPWSFFDDDDLKIVINGEVIKNELPKSHTDWFWCGRAQSNQDTSERTLTEKVDPRSKCLIEIFSDRTPKIEQFLLSFADKQLPTTFNPTNILDDYTFTKVDLNKQEIDEVLKSYAQGNKNHLAYRQWDGKTLADLIYEGCLEYRINPKIVIARLQSENGLIYGGYSVDPSIAALNSALGVGILAHNVILEQYQGFAKQVLNAIATFRLRYDEAVENNFSPVVDGKKMKVTNSATYSLYRYAPLVESERQFFEVYREMFGP